MREKSNRHNKNYLLSINDIRSLTRTTVFHNPQHLFSGDETFPVIGLGLRRSLRSYSGFVFRHVLTGTLSLSFSIDPIIAGVNPVVSCLKSLQIIIIVQCFFMPDQGPHFTAGLSVFVLSATELPPAFVGQDEVTPAKPAFAYLYAAFQHFHEFKIEHGCQIFHQVIRQKAHFGSVRVNGFHILQFKLTGDILIKDS
jgi:hypothetical protein